MGQTKSRTVAEVRNSQFRLRGSFLAGHDSGFRPAIASPSQMTVSQMTVSRIVHFSLAAPIDTFTHNSFAHPKCLRHWKGQTLGGTFVDDWKMFRNHSI